MVEIVMAVEERFAICIPDDAVQEMGNVGGFYRYVLKLLERVYPQDVCMSSAAFYRLRRALMKVAGVPRSAVTPAADLRKLLPFHLRRDCWPKLRAETELPLPPLRRPPVFMWGILICTLALLLCIPPRRLAALGSQPGLVTTAVLVWIIFWVIISIPLRGWIPKRWHTVRGLVYEVLPAKAASGELREYNPEAIWNQLQTIISEQLGVQTECVTAEATWRDLGVG